MYYRFLKLSDIKYTIFLQKVKKKAQGAERFSLCTMRSALCAMRSVPRAGGNHD